MEPATVEALHQEFVRRIEHLPDGSKINQCLQCGTCSGSCPSRDEMDYAPHQIIGAFRAGLLDEIIDSETVWLCASCYSCAVRCPAGIPLTDVMYELKRLSARYSEEAAQDHSATMVQAFIEGVTQHGRSAESELMRRYFLRTNPLAAMKQVGLATMLLRKRRLDVLPHNIDGIEGLRAMLAKAEEMERQS